MAILVSVNVGLPRDVEWQGRTVHTAIWKEPVAGRVMARRTNLDGDGQGDLEGHGGEHRAIMVYQLDSYRYWQDFLHRDSFSYGQFGENFTVDGLSDAEVCIGDRYRIGGALFEVTQPRVTCYRVGIRLNEPSMPSLLVSHKRPGFYFRVLQEGEVGAGDEIVQVGQGPERMTIQEVDGLLYLRNHSREGLTRALRVPALSTGWKKSFESLLETSAEQQPTGNAGLAPSLSPPPAWPGFRELRVFKIEREATDVFSFNLENESGERLPPPIAGQFVALRLTAGSERSPIFRNYSISGVDEAGRYRISVKRASGLGSQYLHDHVRVGDTIQVSAPRGGFRLEAGSAPIVLLGAGIGATPLLAMLQSLTRDTGGARPPVWWCYGARSGREHPFASETQQLLHQIPDSHSYIAYSRPEEADHDYDKAGRLELSSLVQAGLPKNAEFYLCGPTAFIADFTSSLQAWGVADTQIHSENFGAEASITPGIAPKATAAPHLPSGSVGTGPAVSFTRSGLVVPWNDRYKSLLAFAEACDVPVKWSCRAGVCHLCESGLIGGEVQYFTEPLDTPAEGNVLLCCSTPRTPIELDL